MPTGYGLETPRDLFEKLERDAERLDDDLSPDHVFNFVVTAFHLHEWIAKSCSTTKDERNQIVEHLLSHECIRVCRDIANASKHFILDGPNKKYPPEVTAAARRWGPFSGSPNDPESFTADKVTAITFYTTSKSATNRYPLGQLSRQVIDLYRKELEDRGL